MALNIEKTETVVEKYEVRGDDVVKICEHGAMGTVTISDTKDVILVPSPSTDPRGTVCQALSISGDADITIRPLEHAPMEEDRVHHSCLHL